MTVRWSIATATSRPGAIAIIELRAGGEADLDRALASLAIAPVAVGHVALRDLCGIDEGLVARLSGTVVQLMPHAGAGVLRRLGEALDGGGLERASAVDPVEAYPEASDEIEARMLGALARSASPRAIDLLLDQPRRWRAGRTHDDTHSAILNRLSHPPLVVAIGPPNVGKSTLLNTLSGRAVSVVADEPGTTRDHVGVMLELDGLCVRCIDTPGLRDGPDPIERGARAIAQELIGRADLVLSIADAGSEPVEHAGAMRVAARSDLGVPSWEHNARVSAVRGEGVGELARLVRERLVPDRAIEDPRAWRFWREPGETP